MSVRELVILILGLAIVVVVLRGLFLAMRGRRGQIRLAIDKNIPHDVDLNALELAELPGGGARIVARSLQQVNHQNSAVEMANAKAAAMDLGTQADNAVPIPVLMDPVQLRGFAPTERAQTSLAKDRGLNKQREADELDNTVLFEFADEEDNTDQERAGSHHYQNSITDEEFVDEDVDAAESIQHRMARVGHRLGAHLLPARILQQRRQHAGDCLRRRHRERQGWLRRRPDHRQRDEQPA